MVHVPLMKVTDKIISKWRKISNFYETINNYYLIGPFEVKKGDLNLDIYSPRHVMNCNLVNL